VDGLVDIHAHILPGIDDGPADLDDALGMARAAAEAGIGTLVATPHLRSDFPDVHLDELIQRCNALQTAIEAEGVPLRLVGGAEVSLLWALDASPDDLVIASVGQQGKDLLIETPMTGVGGIDQHLFYLRANGFRVTLAHPERSGEFQSNSHLVAELVDQGVLMQVNSKSLLDSGRRPPSSRFARQLCADGLVHVLASDGHRATSWRPVTSLQQGVEAAAAIVGAERAMWMAREAPAAIVAGTELPEAPPLLRASRRRLFGRRTG
jgi:protein-tyrosine phosphatase